MKQIFDNGGASLFSESNNVIVYGDSYILLCLVNKKELHMLEHQDESLLWSSSCFSFFKNLEWKPTRGRQRTW